MLGGVFKNKNNQETPPSSSEPDLHINILTHYVLQITKMSLIVLPIETILQILRHLDECEPEMPYWAEKHREMCRTLMSLRLTCRELEEIATGQLFQTFCLSPSWQSWKKFHTVATSEKLRRHLQTLALERHHDRRNFQSWDAWYDCTLIYQQTMRSASNSPLLRVVDLSLLPNLKIVKAENKWMITKKPRSNVQIPFGRCQIRAISFATAGQQPATWAVLGGLAKITHYDFDVISLNCRIGSYSPWRSLVNIDFSGLKYLRLFFKASLRHNPYDLPADISLLAKLHHLPHLEEFHLDQFNFALDESTWLLRRSTTNVLGRLSTKNWPQLRRLDLRFLTTTVADFKAFVEPHAGTLKVFHLHGGLKCPRMLPEELVQRYYLPHWIRTVVCPRREGAKFTHFCGQPEGSFEPEDEGSDSEDGNSGAEDSGAEDAGAEDSGQAKI